MVPAWLTAGCGCCRLDKVLTIGQMQGKFQLILMPTAGHAIHEDEPDRMAEHLQQFLQRFRIGEPPMQVRGNGSLCGATWLRPGQACLCACEVHAT